MLCNKSTLRLRCLRAGQRMAPVFVLVMAMLMHQQCMMPASMHGNLLLVKNHTIYINLHTSLLPLAALVKDEILGDEE